MGEVTRLRLELIERGLTQRQLATQTGLNRAIVSMITTGRLKPDHRQKHKIAEALRCEPGDLFPE